MHRWEDSFGQRHYRSEVVTNYVILLSEAVAEEMIRLDRQGRQTLPGRFGEWGSPPETQVVPSDVRESA